MLENLTEITEIQIRDRVEINSSYHDAQKNSNMQEPIRTYYRKHW